MKEETTTEPTTPTRDASCTQCIGVDMTAIENLRLRTVNAELANENVTLCIYLAGAIGVVFGFIYARYL